MHDALLFTPLKKLSYISYHFPLKRAPAIFLYFDTSSINSPCFAPFALCLGLLQIRDE